MGASETAVSGSLTHAPVALCPFSTVVLRRTLPRPVMRSKHVGRSDIVWVRVQGPWGGERIIPIPLGGGNRGIPPKKGPIESTRTHSRTHTYTHASTHAQARTHEKNSHIPNRHFHRSVTSSGRRNRRIYKNSGGTLCEFFPAPDTAERWSDEDPCSASDVPSDAQGRGAAWLDLCDASSALRNFLVFGVCVFWCFLALDEICSATPPPPPPPAQPRPCVQPPTKPTLTPPGGGPEPHILEPWF